jgi:hypothetical protein
MKFIRLLIFFILAVVITVAALSFFLPTSQKVERTVVINASPAAIYNQLIKLENFNRFSVWSQQDSSAVYTLTGTDGTVGAATSWKGSPEISGEGKIEIIALKTNERVVHKLDFTQPKKGTAESTFILKPTSNNSTTVTWTFNMATPRPWNIFNLLYSLDEEMGKDFDDGLSALKVLIEANTNIQVTPVINN